MNGLQKEDLQKYFSKFGHIVDIDFQSENNRAMIAFQTYGEAEFTVALASKIVIKNHSVWAKPMKERPQYYTPGENMAFKTSSRKYISESWGAKPSFQTPKFSANCNLIVRNLDPETPECILHDLLSNYGQIISFRLNKKP